MLRMLDASDAAFVLDVFTEVFVWYGECAERSVRLGAVKVANQLLRDISRPRWAEEIMHVRQAREPFLFRVKFFDWGIAMRHDGLTGRARKTANCMSSFHKAVRTIAEARHDPEADVERRAVEALRAGRDGDLGSPADAAVVEAGAGLDEGYGELLIWRVHPKGLISVPEEEYGHMQSSHRYVLHQNAWFDRPACFLRRGFVCDVPRRLVVVSIRRLLLFSSLLQRP